MVPLRAYVDSFWNCGLEQGVCRYVAVASVWSLPKCDLGIVASQGTFVRLSGRRVQSFKCTWVPLRAGWFVMEL